MDERQRKQSERGMALLRARLARIRGEAPKTHDFSARSPHDGKVHDWTYAGQMTGLGKDAGHMWTNDQGYTFTGDAIVEANTGK